MPVKTIRGSELRRTIGIAAIVGVAAILAACALLFREGAAIASRAETSMHATTLTIDVVRTYVEQTGSWPTSWDDLKAVSGISDAMFSWPKDFDMLQSQVVIEFDIRLDDVAKQPPVPELFAAIKPREPAYSATSYRESIERLIDAASGADMKKRDLKVKSGPDR